MGTPENVHPESNPEIPPGQETISQFNVKVVEIPGNHGFCGGIRMTDQVHRMALRHGIAVKANHPPSHNEDHVRSLEAEGLEVVGGDPRVLTPNSDEVYSVSAHGAPKQLTIDALNAGVDVIDTTCPFVRFVEREVEGDKDAGRFTLYGGQRGHQEEIDIRSRNPEAFVTVESADEARKFVKMWKKSGDTRPVVYRQQTTHSSMVLDEIEVVLREGIPDITIPERRDTCQAVRFRQESIIALLDGLDDEEKRKRVLLILGGKKSHNSHAMAEIGTAKGVTSRVISSLEDLLDQESELFTEEKEHVILSSGASTPSLKKIIAYFEEKGVHINLLKRMFAEPPDIVFKFPREQIIQVFEKRGLPIPPELDQNRSAKK